MDHFPTLFLCSSLFLTVNMKELWGALCFKDPGTYNRAVRCLVQGANIT